MMEECPVVLHQRFTDFPITVKFAAIATILAVAAATLVGFGLSNMAELVQDYQELLERDRRLVDTARRTQVVFKIQVQEWKNVLLRGRDPNDQAKYIEAFFAREAETRNFADQLLQTVDDDEIATLIDDFLDHHATLGARYRAGMDLFSADPDDPYRADASVRGMDRAPTDEIDVIVAEIEKLVDARAADLERHAKRRQLALACVAVLTLGGAVVLAVWLARRIAVPLVTAADRLAAAAAGDLTLRLEVDSDDETGRIADAANHLLDALENAITEISHSSLALAAAADQLSQTSQAIGSAAEETSSQAQVVAGAADQIAASVGSVATGADQMNASILEIARNASEAGNVAGLAATHSAAAVRTIDDLEFSGAEIGQVITFIDTVADQTSLLALNATIEAARAGEAGRGFAVVADEVKSLARQTGSAVDGIRQRISAIQTGATESVRAIREISDIVTREHEIASTIASAVEEQSATTAEISSSSAAAAAAASEIADSISSVAQGAAMTSEGITEIATAAHQLADMTERLSALVGRFSVSNTKQL